MFANHKKAKNIHSSLTELALYDTSRVCPVSTPSSAVLLYKVEARWQSALWQEMSSSPIMLWISSVWGQSVVGILFINPHSHIKLVPNPLLPSPPKKKFFSSFVYGQLQTVCDCGTTGANPGQTPSPWWNNPTLLWQRLPEEALHQWVCSAHLHWLKQKPNPLQFSH